MADVTVTRTVPLAPDEAWALVSDLHRLEDWLQLHEAWRSEVPDEIKTGTELSSIVAFKGMRNRIAWTVDKFDPPALITLVGDGKGGTKAELSVVAEHAGGGETTIKLHSEFSNPALRGPLGRVVSRSLKGELEKSIDRLVELGG
jgi:hypothetical protein